MLFEADLAVHDVSRQRCGFQYSLFWVFVKSCGWISAKKELDKQYVRAQLAEAGTPTVIGIDEIPVRRGHEYRIGAQIIAVAIVALAASATGGADAAEHRCDPVTDEGWSVVAERETLNQTDGLPYQSGTDWYVNRVTTVLPFCHYFNSIGVYSMRSYSLDPVVTEERVTICRRTGQSASVAVAPYTGPCPPR
jgi:hypothetical protein